MFARPSESVILSAVLGALLVCAGSLFVLLAPQNFPVASVSYPLWVLGTCVGAVSMARCFRIEVSRSARQFVCLFAIFALASIVWCFTAAYDLSNSPRTSMIERGAR